MSLHVWNEPSRHVASAPSPPSFLQSSEHSPFQPFLSRLPVLSVKRLVSFSDTAIALFTHIFFTYLLTYFNRWSSATLQRSRPLHRASPDWRVASVHATVTSRSSSTDVGEQSATTVGRSSKQQSPAECSDTRTSHLHDQRRPFSWSRDFMAFCCFLGWDVIGCVWRMCKANAKAKAYNSYIAPQAAYRSCSGAVHVTDRAGVRPVGRRLSLRPQTG